MQLRQPVVELQDVSFGYPGHTAKLLRHVHLKIGPHETVLLTGSNGSGKSTLLGLLAGRIAPDDGSVRVFGRDPRKAHRLPEVGLITEPFHPSQSPLPARLSIRRLLAWLNAMDDVSGASAGRAMKELGLSRRLMDQPIANLSKGERQRVMLLVTILRRPRLILADEAVEGLDQESRDIISSRLCAYSKSNQASVLLVSHHAAEASRYADRIFRVEDGSVTEVPRSRYDVAVLSNGGRERITTPTLDVLPELVARRLDGHMPVRLEIRMGTAG